MVSMTSFKDFLVCQMTEIVWTAIDLQKYLATFLRIEQNYNCKQSMLKGTLMKPFKNIISGFAKIKVDFKNWTY